MTAGGEWRPAPPRRRSPFPWLALAGVVATIAAATTLVLGLGDTLTGPDRTRGQLLPLQAASPTVRATRPAPLSDRPATPAPAPAPSVPLRQALLRLRFAVGQGVAAGDVRADVGVDLTNLIQGMLAHPRGDPDVTDLQHKIATRTREGAITAARSTQLHRILIQTTRP
ncbi:hypothetical protein [Actinomadura violacea]|uniref:Uncharacterized protein n=1 Tax=Actinomadura violacea TaxID=2819934 RepID=A0ABS3RTP4_9ACTN|nr:hypothetical protein [Actinomadura violacea]MBO2460011.1 hypothetical protein [Actinomadura violacea]